MANLNINNANSMRNGEIVNQPPLVFMPKAKPLPPSRMIQAVRRHGERGNYYKSPFRVTPSMKSLTIDMDSRVRPSPYGDPELPKITMSSRIHNPYTYGRVKHPGGVLAPDKSIPDPLDASKRNTLYATTIESIPPTEDELLQMNRDYIPQWWGTEGQEVEQVAAPPQSTFYLEGFQGNPMLSDLGVIPSGPTVVSHYAEDQDTPRQRTQTVLITGGIILALFLAVGLRR